MVSVDKDSRLLKHAFFVHVLLLNEGVAERRYHTPDFYFILKPQHRSPADVAFAQLCSLKDTVAHISYL